MTRKLLDITMSDGSRRFYSYSVNLHPLFLRYLIGSLEGIHLIGDPKLEATGECWFDFEFWSEHFSVHRLQSGRDFWFYCSNPNCREEILSAFLDKLEAELEHLFNVLARSGERSTPL